VKDTTTMTERGAVIILKQIRADMKLKAGDIFKVTQVNGKKILLEKVEK